MSNPKPRRRTDGQKLTTKRGKLWLRKRVPLDLCEVLGRSDITTPVGTSDPKAAKAVAKEWAARLETGFAALRSGLVPNEDARAWIRDYASKVIEREQERIDERLAGTLDQTAADDEAEARDVLWELFAEDVESGDPAAVDQVLMRYGSDPDRHLSPEDRRYLAIGLLKRAERLRFDEPESRPAARISTNSSSASASNEGLAQQLADLAKQVEGLGKAKQAKTLGEALKAYVVLKTSRSDWSSSDHPAAVKLGKFAAAMGEHRLLDDVTSEDIANYLGSLRTPQGEPVEVGTKTLHHSGISAFFLEAIRQTWATTNPAAGLRPKRSLAAHESRDALTDDELRKVFGQTLIDEANGSRQRTKVREVHMERLWCPLLSLTMAMRANECAQIGLDNVFEVNGILCVRVAPDEERGRKVKNASSIRTIPVPKVMLDLGFGDYVAQRRTAAGNDPKAQLFEALEPIGEHGYASRLVSYFGGKSGYLNRIGVKRKGLTLHSLRHSAINRLHAAGVDPILRSQIAGHARSGDTGTTTYLKAGSMEAMKQAIDTVDWAVLSGLAGALGRHQE